MEENGNKKDFFKVKVAIFFGYNGLPFHGLQKFFTNPYKFLNFFSKE